MNFNKVSTKPKINETGEAEIDEDGEEILITDLKIKALRTDLYVNGFTATIINHKKEF